MKIPFEETIVLTAEDLRHAKNTHLGELTGIDPSNFTAWTNSRRISERNLEVIAQALGMDKPEVLKGFELRRQDAAVVREVAAKFERLILHRGVA